MFFFNEELDKKAPGKRKLQKLTGEAFTNRVAEIKTSCRDGTLTLGQTVRALRDLTGLSQKDFATKVGVSRSTLGAIESDNRSASLASIDQVLKPFAFEVRIMPKK